MNRCGRSSAFLAVIGWTVSSSAQVLSAADLPVWPQTRVVEVSTDQSAHFSLAGGENRWTAILVHRRDHGFGGPVLRLRVRLERDPTAVCGWDMPSELPAELFRFGHEEETITQFGVPARQRGRRCYLAPSSKWRLELSGCRRGCEVEVTAWHWYWPDPGKDLAV